jgi:outer membrane beta-barrel protein
MRTRVFGIVVLAFLVLNGLSAFAQEKPLDKGDTIRVVQQRPFIKAMRLEIEPTFNLPLNETLTQHVGAGVQLRFHIKEWVAVGADYIKYFGWSTKLAEKLGDDYSVYPEKRLMDFYVGAHVSFVPVSGKFLWLGQYGRPAFWDLYVTAGVGAAKTLFGNYHASGNIGGGIRLAVTSWLTINAEVRDYMYMENYALEDSFVNNFVFTLGLGVFIPFTHKYVHPK